MPANPPMPARPPINPPPPGDWRSSPGAVPPGLSLTDPFGDAPKGGGPGQASDEWQRPSPRLWSLRLTELGTAGGVALVAIFAILSASVDVATGGIGAAVVVVASLFVLVTLRRRVSAWGYAERDDDLLVRRGVLFRRLSIIPYGRMQFVDVTAGPFERLFGLATVRMHTAAAASDARIPGLTADEAARRRDQLTVLGEAQAAGL
jgi:uncharacterized protein